MYFWITENKSAGCRVFTKNFCGLRAAFIFLINLHKLYISFNKKAPKFRTFYKVRTTKVRTITTYVRWHAGLIPHLKRIIVNCQLLIARRFLAPFLLFTNGLGRWIGCLVHNQQKSFFVQGLRHAQLVVYFLAGVVQVGHHHALGVRGEDGLDGGSVVQLELQRL
jgi:hypothetical protein